MVGGRPSSDSEVAEAWRQMQDFGLPRSDYDAWYAQRASAKHRDIPFRFTLLGWSNWWAIELKQLGGERGRKRGQYVMARLRDQGAYEEGNVYAALHADNAAATPEQVRRDAVGKAAATLAAAARRRGDHLRVRGAQHPASRAVLTPDGRFESAALAADHFGMPHGCAQRFARQQKNGWRYEDEPVRAPVKRWWDVAA